MKHRLKDKRGQAMVELAIVLPILLLLLMGIIDFGRVFHGHLAVTTAAREGARLAAVGGTDQQVQQAALAAAAPLEQSLLTVAISPNLAGRYPGDPITIEVRYQMQLLTPIISRFFPNPYIVVGKAVMRLE